MNNTNIPVMGHADGICHVYVDSAANTDRAVDIVVDSKTQYVSVCNATETLLVHAEVADSALPRIAKALQDKGVELRLDERAHAILSGAFQVKRASEEDWKTEYLRLRLVGARCR